jgi:DNA-binding transcriptional MerR regulator
MGYFAGSWAMAKHDSANVVSAFTEEHVSRLTGISKRQLRYWDNDGFFVPSMAYGDRTRPYSRLYSFRDVVSLKVLNELRNESKVSLPHLREVKDKLAHLGDDMWSKTTLYVFKRRVVFDNPETKAKEEVVSGQGVLQIPLKVVTGDMKEQVKELSRRDHTVVGKFDQRRGVAHNQLVIAGTRIPGEA